MTNSITKLQTFQPNSHLPFSRTSGLHHWKGCQCRKFYCSRRRLKRLGCDVLWGCDLRAICSQKGIWKNCFHRHHGPQVKSSQINFSLLTLWNKFSLLVMKKPVMQFVRPLRPNQGEPDKKEVWAINVTPHSGRRNKLRIKTSLSPQCSKSS